MTTINPLADRPDLFEIVRLAHEGGYVRSIVPRDVEAPVKNQSHTMKLGFHPCVDVPWEAWSTLLERKVIHQSGRLVSPRRMENLLKEENA